MKKEILYFCTAYSTFVKKDLAIFQSTYKVSSHLFNVQDKFLIPFSFLRQFFVLLISVYRADIIICQFAGYHSFLPVLFARLFSKPSLIILGGTDCVSLPSIRYGNFQKPLLSIFTKWSCKLAKHLSPVHESLMLCEYMYQDKDFPKQGLRYFIPDLKTPHTTVFNGYDEKKWFRNAEKKKNTFITVAGGLNMPFTFQLKGIDLILEVAPLFPDCEFVIVGSDANKNLPPVPANVKLIPPVKNEELIHHYSRAEFYLQLSMSEGFPNALSEAMLCECIPVVSKVGAMPDIAGETGFILEKKDKDKLKSLITAALNSDKTALGKSARERIKTEFPEGLRKRRLSELLSVLNH